MWTRWSFSDIANTHTCNKIPNVEIKYVLPLLIHAPNSLLVAHVQFVTSSIGPLPPGGVNSWHLGGGSSISSISAMLLNLSL